MLLRRECPQDGGYGVQVQTYFGIRLLLRNNLIGVYGLFFFGARAGGGGRWPFFRLPYLCFFFFYVLYFLRAARGSLASVVRGLRT